jgi:pimeloyl-ACP methyl ester carboxylesterase
MIPHPHVVAINGIRTSTTSSSWPKRLGPYLESRYYCTTEAHHYYTGPVPAWNLWVTNPRIARVLASSIEDRMEEIGMHTLHLVAHSNGTNIAVALAAALAKRGIRVETMVLIGSALNSDVERNGLAALVASGHLRRAVAYCSPDDLVVRRLQGIPGFYGSLGSRAFEREGKAIGLRVEGYQPLGKEWGTDKHRYVSRLFTGYGHSDYFREDYRAATFCCVAADLGLRAAD